MIITLRRSYSSVLSWWVKVTNMVLISLPLVTLPQEELRGHRSFVGSFSFSSGAFIALCTQASGDLYCRVHIPVSYTRGLPRGQVQSPVWRRQSVTIWGQKERSSESVLLDNSVHPKQENVVKLDNAVLTKSGFFKCGELWDLPFCLKLPGNLHYPSACVHTPTTYSETQPLCSLTFSLSVGMWYRKLSSH